MRNAKMSARSQGERENVRARAPEFEPRTSKASTAKERSLARMMDRTVTSGNRKRGLRWKEEV